jgi:aspartate ammonia-lyase
MDRKLITFASSQGYLFFNVLVPVISENTENSEESIP